MAEGLYLNKIKADYSGKPIVRKLQIGTVQEVTERKSSFSYTINLPATSKNLQILDMLTTEGNTSSKPFQEVVADYVVDNVYLVQNGVAIIRSAKDGFININLIDGFKGLANILGSKKINEIDFSDLNHTLTAEVLVDSIANTEGYIYAFADFGKEIFNSVGQLVENQAPSIYLHTVISRIFEEAGFSLIGDFFTTDTTYLKEVLTPCNGYEITPAGTNVVIADILGDINQVDLIKDLANRHGLLMKPNKDNTGFEFRKLQEVLNDRSGAADWTKKVSSYKDENFDSGYSRINNATFKYAEGLTEDLDGELIVDNLNAEKDGSLFASNFEVPILSAFDKPQFSLPNQKLYEVPIWGDYIQKIANVEKTIAADSRETTKRIAIDGTRTNYANTFVDKYTVDVYDKNMSEYRKYSIKGYVYEAGYCMVAYYDTTDTFISYQFQGTATPLSYTKQVLTVPNDTVYIRITGFLGGSTILYERSNFNYDSAEIQTTLPKIMSVEVLACYTQFQYFQYIFEYDSSVPLTFWQKCTDNLAILSLSGMSLQDRIDDNYNSFKDLLDNYKKVELLVNLSLIDIYNFDFFQLVYLKQTGRFYYIDNITYLKDKISKCEALEIQIFV